MFVNYPLLGTDFLFKPLDKSLDHNPFLTPSESRYFACARLESFKENNFLVDQGTLCGLSVTWGVTNTKCGARYSVVKDCN